MMKHKEKPIYGSQFHPEAYHGGQADLPNNLIKLVHPEGVTSEYVDGKLLLKNFFKIAGLR
jgi:anthranilate/para-aminobenzoate synthase component II